MRCRRLRATAPPAATCAKSASLSLCLRPARRRDGANGRDAPPPGQNTRPMMKKACTVMKNLLLGASVDNSCLCSGGGLSCLQRAVRASTAALPHTHCQGPGQLFGMRAAHSTDPLFAWVLTPRDQPAQRWHCLCTARCWATKPWEEAAHVQKRFCASHGHVCVWAATQAARGRSNRAGPRRVHRLDLDTSGLKDTPTVTNVSADGACTGVQSMGTHLRLVRASLCAANCKHCARTCPPHAHKKPKESIWHVCMCASC